MILNELKIMNLQHMDCKETGKANLNFEGWQAKVHIYDSYAKIDVYFCLSTLNFLCYKNILLCDLHYIQIAEEWINNKQKQTNLTAQIENKAKGLQQSMLVSRSIS